MTGTNHYHLCCCVGSRCLLVSMSCLAAMIHTSRTHRGGAHLTQPLLVGKARLFTGEDSLAAQQQPPGIKSPFRIKQPPRL